MQHNFMASPFAAQLGTNYCPEDKEVLEIQTLLVKPALRLKNLDNEIAELQKAIEKLMEERNGLGAYVDAHKALISPVRRLPLDIIAEIFVACLPAHRNCVMSASEAPVLFGRVCRVVESHFPLYTEAPSFHPPTASFNEKVAQRVRVTKMWLGRSGQCPLSISLESAPENSPYDTEVSPATSVQFLQALIPFAPRWQHIHFTTPSSHILEIISHLDIDMPWLETAAFHHQHFPRGSNFDCVHSGNILIPERFPVLWHQLTTLTIGGPSWSVSAELTSEVIFRVISGCPELRCCKVVVHDGFETAMSTTPLQYPILKLLFLHTLAIHCVGSAAPVVSLLLKRLSVPDFDIPRTCPALRDLSIGDGHHSISDAALLRFITARMMLEPRALKSVEVYFGRPMTIDIMPNLRAFIETGLAISLTYIPSPRYSPWDGLPDAPAMAYPMWTPPHRAILSSSFSRRNEVEKEMCQRTGHEKDDYAYYVLEVGVLASLHTGFDRCYDLFQIHVQVVGPVVKTISSAATVKIKWLFSMHSAASTLAAENIAIHQYGTSRGGQLEFQFEQCTIWKLMTSDFDFAFALLRAAKTKLAPDWVESGSFVWGVDMWIRFSGWSSWFIPIASSRDFI
ncbi:hypothetical protein B0H14DRAFT_3154402 [Mycena olivaceomarginata]|nr:hypothetical protein B0H14DRAFT_3154402 [Mycena olivaceomarginata]